VCHYLNFASRSKCQRCEKKENRAAKQGTAKEEGAQPATEAEKEELLEERRKRKRAKEKEKSREKKRRKAEEAEEQLRKQLKGYKRFFKVSPLSIKLSEEALTEGGAKGLVAHLGLVDQVQRGEARLTMPVFGQKQKFNFGIKTPCPSPFLTLILVLALAMLACNHARSQSTAESLFLSFPAGYAFIECTSPAATARCETAGSGGGSGVQWRGRNVVVAPTDEDITARPPRPANLKDFLAQHSHGEGTKAKGNGKRREEGQEKEDEQKEQDLEARRAARRERIRANKRRKVQAQEAAMAAADGREGNSQEEEEGEEESQVKKHVSNLKKRKRAKVRKAMQAPLRVPS